MKGLKNNENLGRALKNGKNPKAQKVYILYL